MQNSDLTIIAKTYDFILWAFNHTEKFPKSSRFSLSVRLELLVMELLEKITIANRGGYSPGSGVVLLGFRPAK